MRLTRLLWPISVAALLGWLYHGTLASLVRTWYADPTFSHGFLVLAVAGWLAWSRLPLPAAKTPATRAAVLLAALAAGCYLSGRAGDVHFLGPVSLLVLLFALGLGTLGWPAMRALLAPYLFLYFAVPWPDLLVGYLSFPMQYAAASYAGMWGSLLGLPVVQRGVSLHVGRVVFEVAAPCSGMRSLVALMALAALMAHLAEGPRGRRLVLFLLGAPVALVANAARILLILVIGANWGQRAAEGFFHGFSGMVLFLLAVGLLVLAGRMLGLRQGALPMPRRVPALAGAASRPVWVPCVLLLIALGVAWIARWERAPTLVFSCAGVPTTLAGWHAEAMPDLDEPTRKMLRPDAHLTRKYCRGQEEAQLFAVFGHRKETFHAPDFCLLGGGYSTIARGPGRLSGGVPCRWSLLAAGDQVYVVLYYFLAGRRPTAGVARQQWYMLTDRMRGRPTGGALIRWTIPVRKSVPDTMRLLEDLAAAAHPYFLACGEPNRGTILAANKRTVQNGNH